MTQSGNRFLYVILVPNVFQMNTTCVMIQNVQVYVIKKRKKIQNMNRRVTVMIDDDLNKRIRSLQAKMIQKENKSISFSHVVNLLLQDAMKK